MKVGDKQHGFVYVPANHSIVVATIWFIGGYLAGFLTMCIVWAYARGGI